MQLYRLNDSLICNNFNLISLYSQYFVFMLLMIAIINMEL